MEFSPSCNGVRLICELFCKLVTGSLLLELESVIILSPEFNSLMKCDFFVMQSHH